MNDTLEIVLGCAALVVPIITGLLAWNVNSMEKRLDTMAERIDGVENEHGKIQEHKLGKEDYYRDQGAINSKLTRIEDNVASIPEKILNMLKVTGNITSGKD